MPNDTLDCAWACLHCVASPFSKIFICINSIHSNKMKSINLPCASSEMVTRRRMWILHPHYILLGKFIIFCMKESYVVFFTFSAEIVVSISSVRIIQEQYIQSFQSATFLANNRSDFLRFLLQDVNRWQTNEIEMKCFYCMHRLAANHIFIFHIIHKLLAQYHEHNRMNTQNKSERNTKRLSNWFVSNMAEFLSN